MTPQERAIVEMSEQIKARQKPVEVKQKQKRLTVAEWTDFHYTKLISKK